MKNPEAMQAVLAARVMRQQENMQAAIDSLKKANEFEPNHPEVLGEMAAIYDDMGIMSRSEAIWRQIYAMGEANAGGYFAIAATKIGNRGGSAEPERTRDQRAARYLGAEFPGETIEPRSIHAPILPKRDDERPYATTTVFCCWGESISLGTRVNRRDGLMACFPFL